MTKDIGDYVIYSHGEVYSKKSSRFLKNTVGNNGYAIVAIYENRIGKKYRIH